MNPADRYNPLEPLDYDNVEAEVRELRERIESELKRKPARPLVHHSRSQSREAPEQDIPRIDKTKLIWATRESQPDYIQTEPTPIERPQQTRVKFTNPIMASGLRNELDKKINIQPSEPRPCPSDDCNTIRDRFYKTKSQIKLDIERNPRHFSKTGEGLSAMEAT